MHVKRNKRSVDWQPRVPWGGVALVTVGLLLAAGSSGSAIASSSSSTAKLTPVRFLADYNPAWPGQVPWNVALDKGWFAQAGLNVVYNLPPTNDTPPRLVGVGKEDVTVSYSPDVLLAKSVGLNVQVLASLMDKNIEGIMTYDPAIKTPKDLVGKTVAIYNFPMARLNFKIMLQNAGVNPSKVKIVNEGAYGVPLIVSGKVDAIDGAAGGELDDANSRLHKTATFFPYDQSNGITPYYWFLVVGNRDWIAKHPVAAKAFTQVMLRAMAWSRTNPDAAAAIFAKRNPTATTPALANHGWKTILKLTAQPFEAGKPLGYMDPAIWQSAEKFLLGQKFLAKPVNITSLLTGNKFLP